MKETEELVAVGAIHAEVDGLHARIHDADAHDDALFPGPEDEVIRGLEAESMREYIRERALHEGDFLELARHADHGFAPIGSVREDSHARGVDHFDREA